MADEVPGTATPPSAAPPPPPAAPAGQDSNRTVMLILAYLGILALIPLLVEKNDKEVQWHAKNGLVLFAAWVAVVVMYNVLIFSTHLLGCFFSLLLPFLWLLYVVVIILAIVKATKGQRFIVPGLSQFADKF